MPPRKIDDWLEAYGRDHRHPVPLWLLARLYRQLGLRY